MFNLVVTKRVMCINKQFACVPRCAEIVFAQTAGKILAHKGFFFPSLSTWKAMCSDPELKQYIPLHIHDPYNQSLIYLLTRLITRQPA